MYTEDTLQPNIISEDLDFILFALYATIGGFPFDPSKDGISIKLHIVNKVGRQSIFFALAKAEKNAIQELIKKSETPFITIVSTPEEAELVITLKRKHIKENGKKKSILHTQWSKTEKGVQLCKDGSKSIHRQHLMVNFIEDSGRKPGYISEKPGAIVTSPAFMEECAYLLLFAVALNEETKNGGPKEGFVVTRSMSGMPKALRDALGILSEDLAPQPPQPSPTLSVGLPNIDGKMKDEVEYRAKLFIQSLRKRMIEHFGDTITIQIAHKNSMYVEKLIKELDPLTYVGMTYLNEHLANTIVYCYQFPESNELDAANDQIGFLKKAFLVLMILLLGIDAVGGLALIFGLISPQSLTRVLNTLFNSQ